MGERRFPIRHNRGLTLVLNFGPWGGVYVHIGRRSWRLCLGWMAFSIYAADVDPVLHAWALARTWKAPKGAEGGE